MIKRQTSRTLIRWAIFIVTLIGIPLGIFSFFSIGTADWIDPFFWIQTIGVILNGGAVPALGLQVTLMIAITVGGLIAFTILFGRAFCSWICPYGTLLTGMGGLKKEKRELPEVMQDRNIKYGIFLGFFLASLVLGRYAWCDICPMGGIWRSTGPFGYDFPWLLSFPIIFFIAVGLMSVYYETRGFCKYLCPLGAFISIVDKVSINRIQLPSDRCVECHHCDNVCPMDIDIVNETRIELLNDPAVKKALEDNNIKDLHRKDYDKLPKDLQKLISGKIKSYKVPAGECIRCYQCVDVCPVTNDTVQTPSVLLDPVTRITNFQEVNKGFTPELAEKEANRICA